MAADIAFLHTSPVHVATFDALMNLLAPDLRVVHSVREDLLAEARKDGVASPALATGLHQALVDAGAGGAAVVVCTCSPSADGEAADGCRASGHALPP